MSKKKNINTEEISSVKGSTDTAQNKGNSYENSEVVNLNKNNIMESKVITPNFSQFENFSITETSVIKPSIHDREIVEFERLANLCKDGDVRLRVTPYSQDSKGCNYVWINCTTPEKEHKFKITLNNESFDILFTYISRGVWLNKDIDVKEGVKEFNELHKNFPLSLIQFEYQQGKKLSFIGDKCYSKYKFGMICYSSYNNEKLKAFIKSIW